MISVGIGGFRAFALYTFLSAHARYCTKLFVFAANA
jgi:hypothetical protein